MKNEFTFISVGKRELSFCLLIMDVSLRVIIDLGLDGGVGSGVFSPSAFINLFPVVGQSVNGLFGLLGGIETSEITNKIYIWIVSVMTNF
jgi:hypothetical protein